METYMAICSPCYISHGQLVFNTRSVHAVFVVDGGHIGISFLRVDRFPMSIIIPPNILHISHLSWKDGSVIHFKPKYQGSHFTLS